MTEEYLKEFERWVAGPKERKAQLRAELEEHLRAAQAAGDIEALKRLGTPREAAQAFSEGHELSLAPLPRRIGAALVDMGVAVALAIAAGGLGSWSAIERASETGDAEVLAAAPVAAVLLATACLWWVVILPVLEWRYGQTLGKRIFGLRVVGESGVAPKFGQVVVRRLTMIFSGPLQLIDWAFMFFTKKHQRAFEIIAKTVVVQDESTATGRFEVAHAQ